MSGYTIRKIGDLPPEEAALIRQDVTEAERGYSLEELEEGAKRMRESSFGVGDVPEIKIIPVQIDSAREAKLNRYMSLHRVSQSTAVRDLLDRALSEI
ncbi:hypothetical protein F4555_000813 [Mobiluncus mulieris]|uniref:Uncharacterized protein n=1 Tax=Mobiluncus mulieris TaxID=2052 RepID=A0A2X1RYA1_9ACTO|nr:hypothetical protein [Mobiluncus mulieris]EEJ54010.1 hypothetical protein HMPREF0577_0946 [Mobiluncus mulieris ATCC 35243]MBB5846017.1 hypothetical protein [Mobiluncus mulieris]MCU9994091.1 hypothetical protein [Mobiluncus mulieris]SPX75777.1 Uncharacterised protein [Mobiluncus mulieris]STO17496.1 Uncharacterised protein [Mobiluncus mulieris]